MLGFRISTPPCPLSRLACLAVLLWAAGPANAQIALSEEPVVAFEAALESARERLTADLAKPSLEFVSSPAAGEDPETELINGTIVDATFFPAVFRATSANQACTASLIGPATALLAAHCLPREVAIASFTALVGGVTRHVRAICERAPGFGQRRSEDWALCILEHAVRGIPFEAVNVDAAPAIRSRIILSGLGCTEEGQAPAVRPLKAGISERVSRPSGLPSGPTEASYIYSRSDRAAGEAILCQGDSGGPVWFLHGSTISDSRMIVGVNSRTIIASGVGLISATASRAGAAFLRDWAERNGQVICGMNAGSNVRCMWNPV